MGLHYGLPDGLGFGGLGVIKKQREQYMERGMERDMELAV